MKQRTMVLKLRGLLCAAAIFVALVVSLVGCGSTSGRAVSASDAGDEEQWTSDDFIEGTGTRDIDVEEQAAVAVFPQLGYFNAVTFVAFSPDGKHILSWSRGIMKLLDVASGREIGSFKVDSDETSVAFSPDRKHILSWSRHSDRIGLGTMILSDVASGQEIHSFKSDDTVTSVAFSPDGKHILSWSIYSEKGMNLWDVASGQKIRSFPDHSARVKSVAFSPDGKQIASGAWDNTVKLWDTTTGQKIRSFKGGGSNENLEFVAFSPDGKRILIRSDFKGSRATVESLWDVASGQEIRSFKVELRDNAWRFVAFSPDGKQLLLSRSSEMQLWDVASGQEIHSFKSDEVTSVAFSPDGKQILSWSHYSSNGVMNLWDVASGRLIRSFKGDSVPVNSAEFSPDGKQIVSGYGRSNIVGSPGTVILWDVASGQEMHSLKRYSGGVASVAFSPDGKQILSGANFPSGNDKVGLWDVASGRPIRSFSALALRFVKFSPDGKQIVSGVNNRVELIDAQTGRLIRSFKGYSDGEMYAGSVFSVAFSPDGKQIVSTHNQKGEDEKLWDVASGRLIRSFKVHSESEYVSSVAFSPDGKRIVSAYGNETVKLRSAATGWLIRSFKSDYSLISATFSPDGKRILLAYGNGTVKLRSAATGWLIRSFNLLNRVDKKYGQGMRSVMFSPDGKQILSVSTNRTVMLWDVASRRLIRSFKMDPDETSLAFIRDPAEFSVAFSPDWKHILLLSGNSVMDLWDVASGRQIRSLKGHSDYVNSVVFSPDGKQILSGSSDTTTRLWDAATGKELAQFVSFSGSDTQITAATRDIAVEVVEEASSVEGEWLSITPDGYYQASPRGDRYLNVRVDNTVSGIDSYRSIFYNPEVVEARLNGRPDPASKVSVTIQEAVSFAPPTVTVQASDTTTTSDATIISVTVVDQNQPIKNIKVIVNARILGRDELSRVSGTQGLTAEKTSFTVTGGLKEVTFDLPVTLDPGDNLIEVIAFNGYSDTRRSATVTWQTNQKLPPPNLWILAIGVNKYDDTSIRSLNYCVSDAQGIIASFKAQEGKHYAKVNTLLIADNAPITPTVKNIRDSFKWLDQAGPRDVILLFLAGHGITEGRNFYFVPKDGVLKTASSIDTSRAISDTDILSVLDAPNTRLIFIDACHSGGVDANLMTRTLMESNGLVFTASQGNERSTEFADLAHGIFTYSIMQGLSGRYNAGAQKDIKILPLSVSVSNFVSQEVDRRTRDTADPRTQRPKVYSLGFPDLTIGVTN